MLTAFFVGWLGLLHCYGMCGGIVGALSMNLDPSIRDNQMRLAGFTLVYSLGRITSYTIAGYISGFSGKIFTHLFFPLPTGNILRVIAGILVMAIGAYVAGWLPKLAYIQRLGEPLWQRLWPLARNLMPIKTWTRAWLFGIIWGWLPCGLTYSMLMVAALSHSPTEGALKMFAFGLGTLPGLWLGGMMTSWLTRLHKITWLQLVAGILLITSGLITVWLNVTSKTNSYGLSHSQDSSNWTLNLYH